MKNVKPEPICERCKVPEGDVSAQAGAWIAVTELLHELYPDTGEWAVVPRQPTEAMLSKFWRTCNGADWCPSDPALTKRQLRRATAAYTAMLAAAPTPPAADAAVPAWIGDLPAPISNPEAWPENYATGFNDAVRFVNDALPATYRAAFPPTKQPAADTAIEELVSAVILGVFTICAIVIAFGCYIVCLLALSSP